MKRLDRNAGSPLAPADVRSITSDYVGAVRSCPDERRITVWSIQHRLVVDQLQTTGRFETKAHFALSKPQVAYSWMIDQMRDRGLTVVKDRVPLWTFLSQPPGRTDPTFVVGQDDRLLRLEIPKGRMLISFHWPWAYRLLGSHPHRFYLRSTVGERVQFDLSSHKLPPKEECERSWVKIFGLGIIHQEGFSRWDTRNVPSPHENDIYRLQATAAYFLLTDLIEVIDDW
jgi:Domain of unknown function (DUF3841)